MLDAQIARKEVRIEAVVIRCGCGRPESHPGAVCPLPQRRVDLGTIAYWHRNPLRRWWHRLTHWRSN